MPLVLIGTRDEPILKSHDIDWATNKIGGTPDWMNLETAPQLICKNCQSRLPLVMQLYCPLEGSPYHRTLYLFACTNRKCFNSKHSWLVLRSQRLDTIIQESFYFQKPNADLVFDSTNQFSAVTPQSPVMDTWCQGQDTWGDIDPDADVPTSNFACRSNDYVDELTQLSSLSLSELQPSPVDSQPLDMLESEDSSSDSGNDLVEDQPWVIHKTTPLETTSENDKCPPEQISRFNSFYISAFEETMLNMESKSSHVQSLLEEYNLKGNLGINAKEVNGSGGEVYEKDNTTHGDTVFYKFFKRISICPEQVVRYSWNGTPLYLRQLTSEQLQIPPCRYCGAPCIFEVQLMPALVNYLRLSDREGIPIEFGTVVIYTCKNSCWTEGDLCKEEQLIVQPDPDAELL